MEQLVIMLRSCKDEDYLTCKKIWNKFNMKNMGDYMTATGLEPTTT